jgi:Tfp pilus assembly protein PilF
MAQYSKALLNNGQVEEATTLARTALDKDKDNLIALRVMADDYGALALLDHASDGCRREIVSITLVEPEYTEGRVFDLGAHTG